MTINQKARSVLLTAALILAAVPLWAQTGTLTPAPFQVVLDNSGNIVNNGCVWTYSAGTSTPVTTWTDKALGASNTNPIRSDSAGRFTAYLVPGLSYKFVYEQPCTPPAHGTVLRTADYVDGVPGSSATVDVAGTAGEALSAGQVAYLSDGSGSKVAGQWYKADSATAYSSTTPTIGFPLTAITANGTGTLRTAGTVTGLTSLSAGGTYYVGTAGALTASRPAQARFVGQADTTTTLLVSPNPPAPSATLIADDFRLSLTTGVCVTTTDVTAATTLYWTPCTGNRITLFDASGVATLFSSVQLSVAVPATTSQMYDVFVFNSSGTPMLELLAWTNDTTRATAIVRTGAADSAGTWTKSGDPTRRYLGNMRTTAVSGQTEDSAAKRLIWNVANRVPRSLRVTEATDSWTYTTLTWRQVNASAANQVAFIVGVAEPLVDLTATSLSGNSSGGIEIYTGIGLDSTSAIASGCLPGWANGSAAALTMFATARLTTYPAVGYHYAAWLEASIATGTTTWYGDHGAATFYQTGMTGWYPG